MRFPPGSGGSRSGTRLRSAGLVSECRCQRARFGGALVCSIYLGLIQTLIIGGLFYLAALAVVGRARPNATTSPQPGTAGVVLVK